MDHYAKAPCFTEEKKAKRQEARNRNRLAGASTAASLFAGVHIGGSTSNSTSNLNSNSREPEPELDISSLVADRARRDELIIEFGGDVDGYSSDED